ncbi:putative 38.1 kDa protein [Wolffia australiana]
MGNALRLLQRCFEQQQPPAKPQEPLGPHGVTPATVGVSALARDLFNFDISSQVPDGLSHYVVSSKKAQANWYAKLSAAWKQTHPPPSTPAEAARLIIQTLKGHKKTDVEGLLQFYGLSLPEALPETLPDGTKQQLLTAPVVYRDISDGDTINVYVAATTIPQDVRLAVEERARARAIRNFTHADALQKTIQAAGFRIKDGQSNRPILEKKYRIRLRGIDAPETAMSYGKEAKEALAKMVQGKSLRVVLYGVDQYERHVGDVFCDGIFIQEAMLRGGHAWHYVAYDRRPEFQMWESEARKARRGLWASNNPQKPWEWRRESRNG